MELEAHFNRLKYTYVIIYNTCIHCDILISLYPHTHIYICMCICTNEQNMIGVYVYIYIYMTCTSKNLARVSGRSDGTGYASINIHTVCIYIYI